MEKIGVLALQGSFAEHLQILGRIPGIEATAVKTIDELNAVDRLILPGGESTAIGKLLVKTGMFPVLRQRIGEGLPVWGTCAGLILRRMNCREKTYSSHEHHRARKAFGFSLTILLRADIPASEAIPCLLFSSVLPGLKKQARKSKCLPGMTAALSRQNKAACSSPASIPS
jgi:hypothetical protein